MEVYTRITERLRGAMWAHHRRLLPERQIQRILAFVYNNKYEYQIKFDTMTCVGQEWGGKVEVHTTPAGHIKRVRVNPEFDHLTGHDQRQLLLSAYAQATKEGKEAMQLAEDKVYAQFLRDIKPLALGIRDNPEFYTVGEATEELPGGTVRAKDDSLPSRTIPFDKAYQPAHVWAEKNRYLSHFMGTPEYKRLKGSFKGKETLKMMHPFKDKPLGAPGVRRDTKPLEVLAPYTAMEEKELKQRNWQAFLDNKHVAETSWTRTRIGDRAKAQRVLEKTGQAWHTKIDSENNTRW
jgi:DNA-binding protein YbaB